jgi:hypothetical protein
MDVADSLERYLESKNIKLNEIGISRVHKVFSSLPQSKHTECQLVACIKISSYALACLWCSFIKKFLVRGG